MSMGVLNARAGQKLQPAEVIAKHLESIGPVDARATANGLTIKGRCLLNVRLGGNGQVEGPVVMASQGNVHLINMTFDSPVYPSESVKYDGKKLIASQFKPGFRTSLAQFFLDNDVIFKEGLFGGILSTSWPLLNLQDKNPRLEYGGIKKVNGRQMHVLKYTPRKGADLRITLFFDADTFQHARTEYERTIYTTDQQRIAPSSGMPTAANPRSSNARINAVEEFSDFKSENGLSLPHTYKFELSVQSEVRPALVDWTFSLTDFAVGVPLDLKESGTGGS
jgi:hypothetical protein